MCVEGGGDNGRDKQQLCDAGMFFLMEMMLFVDGHLVMNSVNK